MIVNASGCLDALTAPDVAKQLDAFVTKTVTPLPREGNEPVRIAETDVGMLNSIGLANPGIERFVADVLPRLAELGVPVWVSVAGSSASEYADLCAALDQEEDVATVELNVSCPNVAAPEDEVEAIVAARALRRRSRCTRSSRRPFPTSGPSPRRRRRRAPTGSRSSTRSAVLRSTSARLRQSSRRRPGALGAGPPRSRWRRFSRPRRHPPAHRRHGRDRERTARARVLRRRGACLCAWNRPLRRSLRTSSRARGARRRVGRTRLRYPVAAHAAAHAGGEEELRAVA